jgi:hypothetical protein
MEKFKHFDIVKIHSYGFEKKYETIIDLSTCKVLWQSEVIFESLEMNSAPQGILVKRVDLTHPKFKVCASCWNKNSRECKKY